MKNLLIGLLMAFSLGASAQFQLADADNMWVHQGASWNGFTNTVYTQYYYFNGDTLINDTSYLKMYVWVFTADNVYSNDDVLLTVVENDYIQYRAAFRQDGDKVYAVESGSSQELLYADFDVEVGDTISYLNIPDLEVESIQFLTLGNETIRVFNTSSGGIYEGIGGYYGLFNDFNLCIEGCPYLNCFTRNDESLSVGLYSWLYECIGELPFDEIDLNLDGNTNIADISLFLASFGATCENGTNCLGDFNEDSAVNIMDLGYLLSLY